MLALLLASGVIKPSSAPWTLIMLAATAVGTFLILIRLLFPGLGEDIPDEIDVSRSAGLWLSSLAAIVALVGAVMKFRESGGNLRDLTDVDRLRDSFDRSERGLVAPAAPASGPAAAPDGRTARCRPRLRSRGQRRISPAISSPASVGLRPTETPAAARASIFPWAVPLPPDTMAPAWPILRPAGAVTPAM